MTDRFCLSIAGISINVRSCNPVVFYDPSEVYRPFFQSGSRVPAFDMHVKIETGEMPDVSGMEQVFESGRTWSLFREGSEYFIVCRPDKLKQARWVARCSMEFNNVSVYCPAPESGMQGGRCYDNPFSYPLDQILVSNFLSERDGVLLHAAGAGQDRKGLVFPGRSGAGKSTLSRLLAESGGWQMLSDDRVIIRKAGNGLKVFGTPWAGSESIAENSSLPLSGIFFIYHGAENRAAELGAAEAFGRLMPVASIPWYDREGVDSIFSFLEEVVLAVPAYDLYFRPDSSIVDFLDGFSA